METSLKAVMLFCMISVVMASTTLDPNIYQKEFPARANVREIVQDGTLQITLDTNYFDIEEGAYTHQSIVVLHRTDDQVSEKWFSYSDGKYRT